MFKLTLSDGTTTVDFLGSVYQVMDGGFDITLPRVKRELVQHRPGFYTPIVTDYEYREAKLRFAVSGATRSAVVSGIQSIERILNNIAARRRITAGARGELQYQWDGTSNITYFEVYGGDLIYPSDALSVAKIHRKIDGNFTVPDIELTLFLSASGYGISLSSDSLTEVPLLNGTVGSKTTGGVDVQSLGYHYTTSWVLNQSYVELNAVDLPGSTPLITKIQLEPDSPFSAFSFLYMGLQQTPFSSKLVYDSTELDDTPGGSSTPSSSANLGYYHTQTYGSARPPQFFPSYEWSVENNTLGMFYAFYHSYGAGINASQHWAVGMGDAANTWGIYYNNDYVNMAVNSYPTWPLGAIMVPSVGVDLADYGTLHPDLTLGFYMALESGQTVNFDYMALLPMSNGLRIWRARTPAVTGTLDFIDDGWRGLLYAKNTSNQVYTPFIGFMEPLKLSPGITQRIYVHSIGSGTNIDDRERTFRARVWIVPTYQSLAI